MNGLDHTLGDLLSVVHQSSVKEVVEHLGVTQFAAKVRVVHQLQTLYEKWKAEFYPEVQLQPLNSNDNSQQHNSHGNNNRGDGGSTTADPRARRDSNSSNKRDEEKMAMCAHLWSVIQINCLGNSGGAGTAAGGVGIGTGGGGWDGGSSSSGGSSEFRKAISGTGGSDL
jgi:hypothetical protein